jgi:hypothetical protein
LISSPKTSPFGATRIPLPLTRSGDQVSNVRVWAQNGPGAFVSCRRRTGPLMLAGQFSVVVVLLFARVAVGQYSK